MSTLGWIAGAMLLLALAATAALLRARAGPAVRNLRVEERLALGPGLSLLAVRAGRRRFLISAGGKEAALLAELDVSDWEAQPEPPPARALARSASGGAGP